MKASDLNSGQRKAMRFIFDKDAPPQSVTYRALQECVKLGLLIPHPDGRMEPTKEAEAMKDDLLGKPKKQADPYIHMASSMLRSAGKDKAKMVANLLRQLAGKDGAP